jgi:hypothetical protein
MCKDEAVGMKKKKQVCSLDYNLHVP